MAMSPRLTKSAMDVNDGKKLEIDKINNQGQKQQWDQN
jgi:hypothetical protein